MTQSETVPHAMDVCRCGDYRFNHGLLGRHAPGSFDWSRCTGQCLRQGCSCVAFDFSYYLDPDGPAPRVTQPGVIDRAGGLVLRGVNAALRAVLR